MFLYHRPGGFQQKRASCPFAVAKEHFVTRAAEEALVAVDPEGNTVIALETAAEIGIDVAQVTLIEGLAVQRVGQAQMTVRSVIARGKPATVHAGIAFRRAGIGQRRNRFTARHQKGCGQQNRKNGEA